MALTFKTDSDVAKRLDKVLQFIEEQGLFFDIECGGFRVSDCKSPNDPKKQNMELVDAENGSMVTTLPYPFECKLQILNS